MDVAFGGDTRRRMLRSVATIQAQVTVSPALTIRRNPSSQVSSKGPEVHKNRSTSNRPTLKKNRSQLGRESKTSAECRVRQ